MIVERIKAMLEACEAGTAAFPPTELYNEDWLLRIILDWFARHGGDRYPLSPLPGAKWFSQAWLPSAFLTRFRGDRLAEARTHADGVLGHFVIGDPGTAALTLAPQAKQLVVLEAKLFARLSAGVRNAPYYDQAARSVACIAETLRRVDRRPDDMEELAFIVLAPQARLDDGIFEWDLALEAIRRKVRRRVEDSPESAIPGSGNGSSRPGTGRGPLAELGRCHRRRGVPQPDRRAYHRQLLRTMSSFQPAAVARPAPAAPFPVRSRSASCPPPARFVGGLLMIAQSS